MASEATLATARPKARCEAALRIAASDLAKRVVADWDSDGFTVEEVEADIFKAFGKSYPIDGYNVAKALEDYCGWGPDAALVEILDDASWAIDRARDVMIAEWVIENKITVPFVVGDQVLSPKGLGVVTEVKASHAKVNVHTPEQTPNSAWVFDAELCSRT